MLDSATRAAAAEKERIVGECVEFCVRLGLDLLGLGCLFTAAYHLGGGWGLLCACGLSLVTRR